MRLRPLLLYIAAVKFRVPDPDCEPLLHDVLLSFMSATTHIEHPRTWLIAAMCNASRAYWRNSIRVAAVETARLDDIADREDALNVDMLERELLVRAILQRLSVRDHLVLRLHYFECLTVTEIATRLRTTKRYATKLVSKALRRVRAEYRKVGATGSPPDRTPPPIQFPMPQRPFAAFRGADMSSAADVSPLSAASFDPEPE